MAWMELETSSIRVFLRMQESGIVLQEKCHRTYILNQRISRNTLGKKCISQLSILEYCLTHPGTTSHSRLAKNLANYQTTTRINHYTAVVFKKSEKLPPLHTSNSLEIIRQTVNKHINKSVRLFWPKRGFESIPGMPHMRTQPPETDSGYSVMGTMSHRSL